MGMYKNQLYEYFTRVITIIALGELQSDISYIYFRIFVIKPLIMAVSTLLLLDLGTNTDSASGTV